MTEMRVVDPFTDYFEQLGQEFQVNGNRTRYKRMKTDFLKEQGYDPQLIDLDYAYDAGNEQNTDILPAISKKEDGSVTEDILLDTNTREGMAWAAASKALYDAYDIKEKREQQLNKLPTAGQSYRTRLYEKLKNKKAPETPQEFGQWGIEHIGWLNYNLPAFGYASMKLPGVVKQNPKAAYAFLHLLDTYGKLPMFTWNGTKRFFNGVLKDPSTYAGLTTLGIGLSGKKFTSQAGKGGLKKALRLALDPAALTMYEGALYAASDDFFRQKVAIEAGPEVKGGQESYDPVRGLTAAGGGALFGGALYGTAKVGADVAPLAIDAVKGVVNKGAESAKARIKERASGTTLYSNPIGPIADEVISRMGGGGEGPPPGRNLDEFGFYSKAEEALTKVKQEKGTGKQFINQIKNQFNVKEKELYWLGLDKFDNDEKVDKKTLIDTVKQNYVKIRENKYSYKQSPTGDNADITDVNELSFNLTDDTTYDNYASDVNTAIEEFELGRAASGIEDSVYDGLANLIGYHTRSQVEAFENNQLDDFIVASMTEKDVFNSKALYQAYEEGYTNFRDFDGELIDFQSERNDFFDDLARNEYLNNPNRSGFDTLGLNYKIEYDRYDDRFTVYDPRGFALTAHPSSLNEAQVLATQDAYDQGYLLMTDPDEADAIAGAVEQQPGDPAKDAGQPLHASYKLDGGSNYRELVLENTSFQGDPDMIPILEEVGDVITQAENTVLQRDQADNMISRYEILPESEKPEFLRTNNTSEATMKSERVNLQLAVNAALQKKKEVLVKYNMDNNALKNPYNASNRVAALEAGPRTHYGSIKNDIGHMRITDRRTNDGEKIMFVEELQSDWSQKRAAMPSPQNIERALDLQRTGERVGEAVAAADNLLTGFLGGTLPGAITENTVQLFDNVKNSMKLMLDNDSRLNQFITDLNDGRKNSPDLAQMEQQPIVDVLDDIEINDFYQFMEDYTRQILQPLQYRKNMLEVFDEQTVSDDIFEKITNPMIEAFTNAYVEKAQGKVVGDNLLSESNIRPFIKRNLIQEREKLRPFADLISNFMKGNMQDVTAERAKLQQNQNFLEARKRYGLVARGPFVQKSDDIVELQLKSLIRRAVEEDHKFIVVAGADVHIDRWGDSYTDAFNTHYGTVVPNAAEKVLKQFDKKAKVFYKPVEEISDELDNAVKEVYGVDLQERNDMLIIPISDEMRKSVKQGMSLFELGSLAGGGAAVMGSQMTQQENTEPGI